MLCLFGLTDFLQDKKMKSQKFSIDKIGIEFNAILNCSKIFGWENEYPRHKRSH